MPLPFRSIALASSLLVAPSATLAAPSVVASIEPVGSLVANVMEGVGTPNVLVEGAGSPHAYALTPSKASTLERADLIFWIGPSLERFLEQPIETIASQAKTVSLLEADGIETLGFRAGGAFEPHDHSHEGGHGHEHHGEHAHEEAEASEASHEAGAHGHEHAEDHAHGEGDHDYGAEEHAHGAEEHAHEAEETASEHEHGHEGHDHAEGAVDPHIWLDPQNAAVMVDTIERALAEADPENAERYAANAAATRERLDTLSREVDAKLAPVRGKPFIVFHDGYHYFEHRFDIEAAGAITISPEVQPGAERIGEIQATIEKLNAACVFSEPQFQPKLVDVVTEGTSARAGTLDPLGADIEPGAGLYFTLIGNLADSLASCLGHES